MRQLTKGLAEAEGAAKKVGASLDMSRMGMGINQLAQGLEDMQYSVGGAMNNLGASIMMFGGSAGLVAVATLGRVSRSTSSPSTGTSWARRSATG